MCFVKHIRKSFHSVLFSEIHLFKFLFLVFFSTSLCKYNNIHKNMQKWWVTPNKGFIFDPALCPEVFLDSLNVLVCHLIPDLPCCTSVI